MNQDIEHRETWDSALLCDMIGKVILVGVTNYAADGKPLEQEQFFGRVESVSQTEGIRLSLDGSRLGEEFALPPDTRSVYRAAPGEYRLRSTGEVVIDPDFTATYSMYRNAG